MIFVLVVSAIVVVSLLLTVYLRKREASDGYSMGAVSGFADTFLTSLVFVNFTVFVLVFLFEHLFNK